MKKFIFAILALVMFVPSMTMAKKTPLEAVREKAYKQKLKEYSKGKWQVLGSKPLDLVLLEHYDRLAQLGKNGHEVEGIASKVQSKNVGKQMALNNAMITYGQEAGGTLKGRVIADMSANGTDAANEYDNFFAAYERLVQTEINGNMEPSFSIYRENPDGSIEVRSYFIVQENAAQKARLRALQEAMKDSEIAREHADMLSRFVSEGLDE